MKLSVLAAVLVAHTPDVAGFSTHFRTRSIRLSKVLRLSQSCTADDARAALRRFDELSQRLSDASLSDAALTALLNELDGLEKKIEDQGLWENSDSPTERQRVVSDREAIAPAVQRAAYEKSHAGHATAPVSSAQEARDAALFEKALRYKCGVLWWGYSPTQACSMEGMLACLCATGEHIQD